MKIKHQKELNVLMALAPYLSGDFRRLNIPKIAEKIDDSSGLSEDYKTRKESLSNFLYILSSKGEVVKRGGERGTYRFLNTKVCVRDEFSGRHIVYHLDEISKAKAADDVSLSKKDGDLDVLRKAIKELSAQEELFQEQERKRTKISAEIKSHKIQINEIEDLGDIRSRAEKIVQLCNELEGLDKNPLSSQQEDIGVLRRAIRIRNDIGLQV